MNRVALRVLQSGPLTTVQDGGRAGLGAIGVSRSGAADRRSYRLANRLVGNKEGAAALEVTAGGLVVAAERDVLVALAGAACPGAPQDASVRLRAGQELRLGAPTRGFRTYVALRGGVDVEPVLGSRSTDVLSGLGPLPLRVGDLVRAGDLAAEPPLTEVAPRLPVGVAPGHVLTVRVQPGPRHDWMTAEAAQTLAAAVFRVTADSNRVGLRLDGPMLGRAVNDELPSEGLMRGAVQLPPSGLPLVFVADHPATGGYPVVAYVDDGDVDLLAQLRPGDALRFRLS